jgi:hypothetical protein
MAYQSAAVRDYTGHLHAYGNPLPFHISCVTRRAAPTGVEPTVTIGQGRTLPKSRSSIVHTCHARHSGGLVVRNHLQLIQSCRRMPDRNQNPASVLRWECTALAFRLRAEVGVHRIGLAAVGIN